MVTKSFDFRECSCLSTSLKSWKYTLEESWRIAHDYVEPERGPDFALWIYAWCFVIGWLFFSCSIRYLIHGDRERNWDIQSPLECAMLFCLKMKMRSGLTKSFLKADARTQNLSTSIFAFRKANIGASYVFGNPCENLKTEQVRWVNII